MSREKLPARRPQLIRTIEWRNRKITIGLGIDVSRSCIAEVFADMEKGGELAIVCRDAAVAMSIALQHGATPAELAKSMLEVPVGNPDDGLFGPASPVGQIAAMVLDAQTEVDTWK